MSAQKSNQTALSPMDHISIGAAAASISRFVYSLSGQPYSYTAAAEDAHGTVLDLCKEVIGLAGLLSAIATSLKGTRSRPRLLRCKGLVKQIFEALSMDHLSAAVPPSRSLTA